MGWMFPGKHPCARCYIYYDQDSFRKRWAFNHPTDLGSEIEVSPLLIRLVLLLQQPPIPYHLRKQGGPGTVPPLLPCPLVSQSPWRPDQTQALDLAICRWMVDILSGTKEQEVPNWALGRERSDIETVSSESRTKQDIGNTLEYSFSICTQLGMFELKKKQGISQC